MSPSAFGPGDNCIVVMILLSSEMFSRLFAAGSEAQQSQGQKGT